MKILKTNRFRGVVFAMAAVVVLGLLTTQARAGDCCSANKSSAAATTNNQAGREHAGHDHQNHGQPVGLDSIIDRPPHGGQITKIGLHYFEIVYQPQETRVYIYGPAQRPVSASGVRGEVVMAVRGNPELFRYSIGNAAGTTAQAAPEYLSLPVDVSPIRDGDMQVTFLLANLPYQQEPQARFTQTFAISRATIPVTVAKLTAYDQLDVQRQGICPVTDSPLNDHGQPIKLIVGAEPLYVCCDGCIDKVRKRPEFFLQKARAGGRPIAALRNGR